MEQNLEHPEVLDSSEEPRVASRRQVEESSVGPSKEPNSREVFLDKHKEDLASSRPPVEPSGLSRLGASSDSRAPNRPEVCSEVSSSNKVPKEDSLGPEASNNSNRGLGVCSAEPTHQLEEGC